MYFVKPFHKNSQECGFFILCFRFFLEWVFLWKPE